MTNNKLDQLQETINYKFTNPPLLELSLTHRSHLNESNETVSNERLEFLGDAVLELIISEFLYQEKIAEPEGILTAARSAIVRTESLANVAQKIRLGEYLKMSFGEEKSGGRENISLLANTTEALIGAIYLDGGLDQAKAFIHLHILPLTKKMLDGDLKDPKSLLQEKVQDLGFLAPTYTTIGETGPDHDKTFTVSVHAEGTQLATGTGKNKQTAQQSAAQKALKLVHKLAPKV